MFAYDSPAWPRYALTANICAIGGAQLAPSSQDRQEGHQEGPDPRQHAVGQATKPALASPGQQARRVDMWSDRTACESLAARSMARSM